MFLKSRLESEGAGIEWVERVVEGCGWGRRRGGGGEGEGEDGGWKLVRAREGEFWFPGFVGELGIFFSSSFSSFWLMFLVGDHVFVRFRVTMSLWTLFLFRFFPLVSETLLKEVSVGEISKFFEKALRSFFFFSILLAVEKENFGEIDVAEIFE